MTRLGPTTLFLSFLPGAALAHVSEQGLVLLLPTGHYIAGGAAAVVLTVALLAIAPAAHVERLFRPVRFGWRFGHRGERWTQALALALLAALIWAGMTGSRDPLENALTLFVWTVFWIGIIAVQGLLFDLWRWINPFPAVLRFGRMFGLRPVWRYRRGPAHLPGFILFVAFAGFFLADPAPADPSRLAGFLLGYVAFTAAALWLFGARWLLRGEFLTVYMRAYRRTNPTGAGIGLPGWKLVKGPVPGVWLAVFMLSILAVGSFDGLNETFWWLGLIGINPLEFPGRSAVIGSTLGGLAVAILGLLAAYAITIRLGMLLSGGGNFGRSFRAFAPSLLPIAIGYHVAHYLTSFLVESQYVASLVSETLGLGHVHVTTGFFNTLGTVRAIWLGQAGAVVLGHVVAILVAHALALRQHGDRRAATLSQLPLALFMIGYTIFGLWLLASPRGV